MIRHRQATSDDARREHTRLTAAAHVPYRDRTAPQLPRELRDHLTDHLAGDRVRTHGWAPDGAAAELAHLRRHWDALQAAANDLDRHAAPGRAHHAARAQVLGAGVEAWTAGLAYDRTATGDLETARTHLQTVDAEIGHRTALPPLAQELEDHQRAEHRRQTTAERARQHLQQRQDAEHTQHAPHYDHYLHHGPDHGSPGKRM
ncbi:hypothetical protein ACIBF1_30195 [Spirillospora sp. NPDC050679]